ncbi:unnamed protein product [Eruca vesicaria subsp. sativa]|uniref:Uncharacterized protein n=1 Tax=Eruca vesicaria subsp. sativa TaxID=29727 RepID=A0ABC8K423_ERUVS|nr:unnamed protein product [Eruca vesicaria subsp. sativa]
MILTPRVESLRFCRIVKSSHCSYLLFEETLEKDDKAEKLKQLAEGGAHVVMAVRNIKAAQELIQQWRNEWSGKGLPLTIEAMELDLLSLDSVVRFADAWNARLGPLHVLINNAGIFAMGEAQKFSEDGYEQIMQVSHLAPSLLSVLLLPSLIRDSPSRITNVNSVVSSVITDSTGSKSVSSSFL